MLQIHRVPNWAVAAAIFATASVAHSQAWVDTAPKPTAYDLNDSAWVSPTHGFVIGQHHTVLETLDGGDTWQGRGFTDVNEPFYAIRFVDANNGLLLGNSGDCFRTTDGGVTWSAVTLPAGSWSHVDYISGATVFAGGNGALARSLDGGATWKARSGYPGCPVIFGMDFVNGTTGLVGGVLASTSEDGIFKTTDAGATWQKKLNQSANDVIWLTNTTALAIVGTRIYRSTNSGDTWLPFSANEISTGLLDLCKISSTAIVGVSGAGDVWRSADGGLNWTLQMDGPGALPSTWSVSFSDADNGWVVGQTGFIFKTQDGGVTWNPVNNGIGVQFYKVKMADDNVGFAAGENGYVARTRDGGWHWDISKVEATGQVFGREESLRSVSVLNRNFVVVAGPGGTVFKTLDGGESWINIGYPNLPDSFFIEDVEFISPTKGWLVGVDRDLGHTRTFYATLDGGETWTLMPGGGGRMVDVEFAGPDLGIVLFAGGRMYRTVDGGSTWKDVWLQPRFTSPLVDELKFFNKSIGWIVGWDGLVAKTTDGGRTWSYQPLPDNTEHFFAIAIEGRDRVVVSGRTNAGSPVSYRTVDGGAHWAKVPSTSAWLVGTAALPGGSMIGCGMSLLSRFDRVDGTVPTSFAVTRGLLNSGGLAEISSSNNAYLVIQNRLTNPANTAPAQMVFEAKTAIAAPTSLTFTVEASVSRPGIAEKLELFNFATGAYQVVEEIEAAGQDRIYTFRPLGNLKRFIEPTTGTVRARLSFKAASGSLPAQWTARIDHVFWRIAP
jgi:photosystem II stability/assembly factor-like uncharacterized protein